LLFIILLFHTTCFDLRGSSSGVLLTLHYCCTVRPLTFSCPKLLLVCVYIPNTVIFCTWC
jgi:hypothetical protein